MYKQIYVNGCSFTYGYGLDIPEFLKELNKHNQSYPNWNSPKEELTKFREENNWPSVLQKHINIPVINEADFGGSFERAIRMTFDFISTQETPSDTLYIIEIPNAVRKDVWSLSDKKWKKITGDTSDWESYNDFEKDAIQNWYSCFENSHINMRKELLRLFMFASFLKEKKCDFLIIPSEQLFHIFLDEHGGYSQSDMDKYGDELSIIDKNIVKFEVDKQRHGGSLLKHDSSNFTPYEFFSTNLLVFYDSFLNMRLDTDAPELEDGHPSLEGHKKIGEGVYKYLEYYLKIKGEI